jgi:hypothetical protein
VTGSSDGPATRDVRMKLAAGWTKFAAQGRGASGEGDMDGRTD